MRSFLGTFDHFYQWFNGFVESEQQAEKGYKKLFIREKVAIFERPLNCSHRHITLTDLAKWITKQTGIPINIPQADYATTPIPLFTHNGSGYQLLHNIGRQFNIPHYIWQQSADGSLYIGSHHDSRWHGKAVEIAEDIALKAGSNEMILPIYAAIRPGAIINNNIIQRVELDGDQYRIEWENLNQQGERQQKTPERRAIEKISLNWLAVTTCRNMAKSSALLTQPKAEKYVIRSVLNMR